MEMFYRSPLPATDFYCVCYQNDKWILLLLWSTNHFQIFDINWDHSIIMISIKVQFLVQRKMLFEWQQIMSIHASKSIKIYWPIYMQRLLSAYDIYTSHMMVCLTWACMCSYYPWYSSTEMVLVNKLFWIFFSFSWLVKKGWEQPVEPRKKKKTEKRIRKSIERIAMNRQYYSSRTSLERSISEATNEICLGTKCLRNLHFFFVFSFLQYE